MENLVKSHWFSWESLETMVSSFKYVGKDATNKPVTFKAKKMKNKTSRKVVGTFSEIANFIWSFTQVAYNNIQDRNNDYWQWLLCIRKFLRFVTLYKITETQVQAMEATLEQLMSFRFKLTKRVVSTKKEDSKISENNEDESEVDEEQQTVKTKPNLDPPLVFKEHYLRY